MHAYVFISELPVTGAEKSTEARNMVEVSHNSHGIQITKFTGVRHPSLEFDRDIWFISSCPPVTKFCTG